MVHVPRFEWHKGQHRAMLIEGEGSALQECVAVGGSGEKDGRSGYAVEVLKGTVATGETVRQSALFTADVASRGVVPGEVASPKERVLLGSLEGVDCVGGYKGLRRRGMKSRRHRVNKKRGRGCVVGSRRFRHGGSGKGRGRRKVKWDEVSGQKDASGGNCSVRMIWKKKMGFSLAGAEVMIVGIAGITGGWKRRVSVVSGRVEHEGGTMLTRMGRGCGEWKGGLWEQGLGGVKGSHLLRGPEGERNRIRWPRDECEGCSGRGVGELCRDPAWSLGRGHMDLRVKECGYKGQ